jgi:probable HAF family extracellular repeat protein
MKQNKASGIFAASVALFCMVIIVTAQAVAQGMKEHNQKYKVVDLGTLAGSFSEAFGVNNRGDVVGYATVGGDISLHAFLWHDGLISDLGILGVPESLPVSIANSINDAREVVGLSETSVPDPFGENFCGDFLVCLPQSGRTKQSALYQPSVELTV